MYHTFIEFIILLDNFLVIYMIFLISFSNCSDVLSVFTCARAIGNLWNICLGVTILFIFAGNILLSKTSRTLHLPSKNVYRFLRTPFAFLFFYGFCGLVFSFKFIMSPNKLLWSSTASFKIIIPKVFIARKFLKLYVYSFVL